MRVAYTILAGKGQQTRPCGRPWRIMENNSIVNLRDMGYVDGAGFNLLSVGSNGGLF